MQARSFTPDVMRTPTQSAYAASVPPNRPVARHRYLDRDDFRWGCDPWPPSPPRKSRQPHYRVAAQPSLPTIYEDWRLRCRRIELNDPTPGSMLRFSGIYCPPVMTLDPATGTPCLLHGEYLENFSVLREQSGCFVNVTKTMNVARRDRLYDLALRLYRDSLRCGFLR